MQEHSSDGVGLGIDQKIQIGLRQTLDVGQHLPTREVEHRRQSPNLRCKAGLGPHDPCMVGRTEGTGKNYLIQHSAGSGKTNSISWLSHRLALVFADENSLLRELVLLPQGAGGIGQGGCGTGRGSNFPEGPLALSGAVGTGAEQALLFAQRSGTGMLGIAGQAKGLGLTVDY